MVKSFVAAALCMALVACAMGGKRAPQSVSPSAEHTAAGAPAHAQPTGPMPGDPRAEIERLAGEIDAERGRMGLAAPTLPAGAPPQAEPMGSTPVSTDPSCKHANTDTCNQSCTLSDSICSNAARICKLATQLAGDEWAAGKCAQAKQTCESAHQTCCSCQ